MHGLVLLVAMGHTVKLGRQGMRSWPQMSRNYSNPLGLAKYTNFKAKDNCQPNGRPPASSGIRDIPSFVAIGCCYSIQINWLCVDLQQLTPLRQRTCLLCKRLCWWQMWQTTLCGGTHHVDRPWGGIVDSDTSIKPRITLRNPLWHLDPWATDQCIVTQKSGTWYQPLVMQWTWDTLTNWLNWLHDDCSKTKYVDREISLV